jgi:hypothetical protein
VSSSGSLVCGVVRYNGSVGVGHQLGISLPFLAAIEVAGAGIGIAVTVAVAGGGKMSGSGSLVGGVIGYNGSVGVGDQLSTDAAG